VTYANQSDTFKQDLAQYKINFYKKRKKFVSDRQKELDKVRAEKDRLAKEIARTRSAKRQRTREQYKKMIKNDLIDVISLVDEQRVKIADRYNLTKDLTETLLECGGAELACKILEGLNHPNEMTRLAYIKLASDPIFKRDFEKHKMQQEAERERLAKESDLVDVSSLNAHDKRIIDNFLNSQKGEKD
jgi:hypothetical protein